MKHELLYQTQTQFTAAQGNSGNVTSITPGVAYIVETATVPHFNKAWDVLTVVYDVEDISEPTKIYNATGIKTNLKAVFIDKTEISVSDLGNTYQFTNEGKHTVRYCYSSLTRFPNSGFTNCTNLVSVHFPNSLTGDCLGTYGFSNTGLQKVKIPKKTTRIANECFLSCRKLKELEFQNTDSLFVGVRAFEKCAITKVSAKDEANWMRITWDDTGMLGYNGGTTYHHLYLDGVEVTSFTVPDGYTSISQEKFYGCRWLESVTMPSGLTSIGKEAFANSGLINIEIPDTVTTIGVNAFRYCNLATCELQLPSGLTTIENGAFSECTKLNGALTIPDTVTRIGNSAFTNCYGLDGSLTLSSSLTTIGTSAFTNCTKLTGPLVFPETLTTIGAYAFCSCRKIDGDLTIPDTVTSIGGLAFAGMCGLTNIYVYVPSGATRDILVFRFTGGSGEYYYTGNKTGEFHVYGPAKRGGDTRLDFQKIIFHDDYNDNSSYFMCCCPMLKEVRVMGNFTGGSNGLLHTYSRGGAQLEFVEILGQATGQVIYGSGSASSIKKNGIIHIAYDGKTNLTAANIFASNYVTNIQTPKVYFGDGSSQEHDQAILDQYLEDAGWAAQASKLDIWYNYHGEYREE